MPILKRDDGIQFAIQAYRELLQPIKKSLLKNEIRMLAQNHGEYVRLFKQPTGQIEAVFSRDPGFLLGEAIWQHFGKPNDLIYCETLTGGRYALVVVVRSGSVYLDAKIPFPSIADEFSSLLTGAVKYDIYVYGNVPVSNTQERGKFVFDPAFVKSFTRLEQPVFPTLPIDDNLQLLPLEFALRAEKVSKKTWMPYLIGGLILLLFIVWWYHHITTQKIATPVAVAPTTQAQVDSFQGYKAALMTPAPEKQLAEFVAVVNLMYQLPGWEVTGVTFNNGTYTITLNPMGGGVMLLRQWARAHGALATINSAGVNLTIKSNLDNRATPSGIYHAEDVIATVIDRVDQMMSQRSVSVGNAVSYGNYGTTNMAIQFTGISPDVLILVGRQLADLPAQINSIQVTVGQGVLSGTIQLSILGN